MMAMAGMIEPFMTQDIADELCYYMAEFGEPLAVACRREGMPKLELARKWFSSSPEATQQLNDAKELGGHVMATRLREIARGSEGSTNDVTRDKLVIDTDFKLLKAWHPSTYGDKVEANVRLSLEELVMQSMKVESPTIDNE